MRNIQRAPSTYKSLKLRKTYTQSHTLVSAADRRFFSHNKKKFTKNEKKVYIRSKPWYNKYIKKKREYYIMT